RRFAFFFFTHTSPTERSPLSLHDALPISGQRTAGAIMRAVRRFVTLLLALICPASAFAQRLPAHVYDVSDGLPHVRVNALYEDRDRKSTRLNSSHVKISYAVFCLKKKKKK